jgi:hypothetical protein
MALAGFGGADFASREFATTFLRTDTRRAQRFVVSFQNISQAIFTKSRNARLSKRIKSATLQENTRIKSKLRQYGATEAASVVEQ